MLLFKIHSSTYDTFSSSRVRRDQKELDGIIGRVKHVIKLKKGSTFSGECNYLQEKYEPIEEKVKQLHDNISHAQGR